MQEIDADVFYPLQVATQIGLFLAEGVVPLGTFLRLQAVFGAGAGLHGHDQAVICQLLKEFWHLGTDGVFTLVEVINQQVAEHVGGGPHTAVCSRIGGQFTDQQHQGQDAGLELIVGITC
ncbi:hypothetical protein D9M68_783400 [compost metagenome]